MDKKPNLNVFTDFENVVREASIGQIALMVVNQRATNKPESPKTGTAWCIGRIVRLDSDGLHLREVCLWADRLLRYSNGLYTPDEIITVTLFPAGDEEVRALGDLAKLLFLAQSQPVEEPATAIVE